LDINYTSNQNKKHLLKERKASNMSQQASQVQAANENKQSTKNQQQQRRQQGKQSFNGKGGIQSRHSRGGNHPIKKSTAKKDSKTVIISGILFNDLFSSNIDTNLAEKLKDQRIRLLRDMLYQFGDIESVEAHLDSHDDNYMLVTFKSRDSAKTALQTLRSKDKLAEEMEKIRSKLAHQKQFPPNVCPELFKYSFGWYDYPVSSNRGGSKKVTEPKNVIANSAQNPTATAETAPRSTEKKDKKKKQQKAQDVTAVAAETEQKANQKQQKSTVSQQGSGDLQRQAEKAKLVEELKYLQNQQAHVASELEAEKKRAKERDERIERLSIELKRIREEEQALTNKLNAENTYRQDGELRIQKLNQELNHMKAEEQVVLQKMRTTEQQEKQQNGGY
jgi:hypothetical protein